MKKIRFLAVIVLIGLLSTGCGNMEKLGGKVVLSDGTPIPTGIIYFTNDDYLARAMIMPDGSYDVGSLGTKDGIPPGKYKVYIVGAVATVGNNDEMRSLIDAKFCDSATTPLEITVPGEKVFNITVEPPAAK